MKRKTLTGFICGLIGSLFSLFWGFWAGIVGNIGTVIAAAADSSATGSLNIVNILGWLAFIGGIIGIVGSAMCFKKARTGAIWLTIATLMSGSLLLYIFIQIVMAAGATMLFTWVIVFLLPAILLAVATIFAWLAKPVNGTVTNNPYVQNNNYQPQPQVQPQPQQKVEKTETLEDKLQNLKNMYDKGLITEDEYNEARKNILSKNV